MPENYPVDRQIVLIGTMDVLATAVERFLPELEELESKPLNMPWNGDETAAESFRDGIAELIGRDHPFWHRYATIARMISTPDGAQDLHRLIYGIGSGTDTSQMVAQIQGNVADDPVHPKPLVVGENTLVGDQHCISGSPSAGPFANRKDFRLQWIWDCTHGINLPVEPSPLVGYDGTGVAIGIFDSSPFTVDKGSKVPQALTGILPTNHPYTGGLLACRDISLPKKHSPDAVAFRHHGLCVASLARHVAQGADVHLYQVLNDYLEGKSSDLVSAIDKFANDQGLPGSDWAPAVISLSLHTKKTASKAGKFDLGKTILWARDSQRVLTVASAGNDSQSGNAADLCRYPASHSEVLSVGASSYEHDRAWFSNQSAVRAPGCGSVAIVDVPPATSDGYLCVSGSSYAVPLVSGLVARLLTHPSQPPDLFGHIQTHTNAGVIDVADALS